MRVVERTSLIRTGKFAKSKVFKQVEKDILEAIGAVQNPPGSGSFTIFAESGKKRGKGNGVKPIKEAFIAHLVDHGWLSEKRIVAGGFPNLGAFDALWLSPGSEYKEREKTILELERGQAFAIEWETGNISSSHRAVNKMALGIQHDVLLGGALILPTRKMYVFLTDRVGNYQELTPYFPMWSALTPDEGVLEIIAIEHDAESSDRKLRIGKGTDGRALQ